MNQSSEIFNSKPSLEPIKYDKEQAKLSILNQNFLPSTLIYEEIHDVDEVVSAIKEMKGIIDSNKFYMNFSLPYMVFYS